MHPVDAIPLQAALFLLLSEFEEEGWKVPKWRQLVSILSLQPGQG
jgi:hypothetical protein